MIDLEIKTYLLGMLVGSIIAILHIVIESFLIASIISIAVNVLVVILIAHMSVKEENKCS